MNGAASNGRAIRRTNMVTSFLRSSLIRTVATEADARWPSRRVLPRIGEDGRMTPPLTPWPRLRDSWWVFGLAGVAIALFPIALVVEVRCGRGRCAGAAGWERLFALDAV